jgi:hypothetical protein
MHPATSMAARQRLVTDPLSLPKSMPAPHRLGSSAEDLFRSVCLLLRFIASPSAISYAATRLMNGIRRGDRVD